MQAAPILDVLCRHACRFVVVGSTARSLVGEPGEPNDLDIVADGSLLHRSTLVDALVEMQARVDCRHGRVSITAATALPWEWGWRAVTAFGEVDVVTRFIDGTTLDDHEALASTVTLPSGNVVRCHPTRWVS